MKLLWIPCWYDFAGGEAYNVILEKENGKFNKNKVSMEFEFDESTKYVISVEDGVLSLRKEYWNDYAPNDYIDLVDAGVAAKDDLNEIITVLKAFDENIIDFIKKQEIKKHEEAKRKEELAKRKKEWLSSSSYEVEIKGWEW